MSTYNETKSEIKDFASDTVITTEAKGKLLATNNIPSMSISIKTEQGVVHLTGTVKSEDQKTKAESIVRSVNGVKNVQNDLTVKPE